MPSLTLPLPAPCPSPGPAPASVPSARSDSTDPACCNTRDPLCCTSDPLGQAGKMLRPDIGGLVAGAAGAENTGAAAVLSRDAKLTSRHIRIGDKRTTIALESAFWRKIDRLAARMGQTWQEWTAAALAGRSGTGKARWLRVMVLAAECGGADLGQ